MDQAYTSMNLWRSRSLSVAFVSESLDKNLNSGSLNASIKDPCETYRYIWPTPMGKSSLRVTDKGASLILDACTADVTSRLDTAFLDGVTGAGVCGRLMKGLVLHQRAGVHITPRTGWDMCCRAAVSVPMSYGAVRLSLLQCSADISSTVKEACDCCLLKKAFLLGRRRPLESVDR